MNKNLETNEIDVMIVIINLLYNLFISFCRQ